MRSVRGEPSTLPLWVERKVVWQGVTVCLSCADRGMFWRACTSCFRSDRPHSVFTVSRTGNSSAGEALAERCGSTIITAGAGPCHITQQYKFDLDQVWAHDYIFVKLAERFMRILCCLSAFILVAEEHAVPEPQRVRAVWATELCCSSHPAGAKLTRQSFVWTNGTGREHFKGNSMLCHAPMALESWQHKPPKYFICCQTLAYPIATDKSGGVLILLIRAIFHRIYLCFALLCYSGPCILFKAQFCGELKTM